MLLNISDLLKSNESQNLEFKESFNKETIETIAAFSNASGGTVLIGVSDKGKITGINTNNEIIKDWVNSIKQMTQPQIFPEINSYEFGGRTIASIVVQEFPVKPVSCRGKYFKRIGSSNHQIPLNEIVEMQLYSLNSSFDSFVVAENLEQLDLLLIKNFFKHLSNAGRLRLYDDPIRNLKQIGLLKDDKVTFAALLLFGNHNTNIHIGRFKSNDIIVDDILITTPLIAAVDEAMTFIRKNISLRYDFTGELRRKETWQYPLTVLRELLLNAVIHKDYRNPTDIIIKIFDDSISFVNPGTLMGGLKPEDLLAGNYVAIHRNKLLAEVFYLKGDIEKFGTGFFRIKNDLLGYPEVSFNFDSIAGFSRANLQLKKQDTEQDTEQHTEQHTEQVIRLVKTFTKQELSASEMMETMLLKHRPSFLYTYLRPALANKYIEMTIPDKPSSKNQKYRLTTKGKKIKEKLKRESNK